MRNIEKQFTNYIRGINSLMTKEELLYYASKDADELLDSIFNVINKELNFLKTEDDIKKIKDLLSCVQIVLQNSDNIDRKKLENKINKCFIKISRMKIEKKKKFKDLQKTLKELNIFEQELEQIETQTIENDTKQFELINYLIKKVKNITYLEHAFEKMPKLVSVKDKDGNSLLYTVLSDYINIIKEDEKEDILYYENVISLILSNKKYSVSEKEKRKNLDLLYKAIDKLSIDKKQAKKNKEKIEILKSLTERFKGNDKRETKINKIAQKYSIEVFFDEKTLEKAKLTKVSKTGEMTDRKIVDDYIITIDKKSTVEIDDGLSCIKLPNGNYRLGVHIASILAYFPYDSDIVQNAIKRSRSIYLSEKYQTKEEDYSRTIPIFPYEFSAKNASLLPNEPRLARSYFFEIDENGNIVNEEFKKTIIRSNKKTTYKEIDSILKEGSSNKKLEETIKNLSEVTNILNQKYKMVDLYEKVKESTDDYSDLRVRRNGSENIVYEAMLLTGNRVAEFFSKNNYPCLYRVHEVNEENNKKISAMLDNLTKTYTGEEYKKLYKLIEGIYPKGWYATKGSHAGLGLEHYCHCTSGLRRAADIVVEHALEVCYDKTPTEEELEELKKEIEEKAKLINSKQNPIEWFAEDYKRSSRKKYKSYSHKR